MVLLHRNNIVATLIQRLTTILLLSGLTAFAESPWFYAPTTNELISFSIPAINVNLTATLGGFAGTNDAGGGSFQWKAASARTVDWINIFPSLGIAGNGRYERIREPVGTNAPTDLRVNGGLAVGNIGFPGTGNLVVATNTTTGSITVNGASVFNGTTTMGSTVTMSALGLGMVRSSAGGVISVLAGTTGNIPYYSSSVLTATGTLFTDGTKVGLGNVSPTEMLTITSSGTALLGIDIPNDNNAQIFYDSGTPYWAFKLGTSDQFIVREYGVADRLSLSTGGAFKIGRSLYVGSVTGSDPGDNNMLVEGNITTATETVNGAQTVNGAATFGSTVTATGLVTASNALTVSSGHLTVTELTANGLLYATGGKVVASLTLPGSNGYILSGTTAGVYSWVANGAGAAVADPTGLIGMSIVNGTAGTATRSDGHTAIDPAIAPTWTGQHTFVGTPILKTLATNYTTGLRFYMQTNYAGSVGDLADMLAYRENSSTENNTASAIKWVTTTGANVAQDSMLLDSTKSLTVYGRFSLGGATANRYAKFDASNFLSTTNVETVNTVFAGPTSGGAAVPAFRALVAADLLSGNRRNTQILSNLFTISTTTDAVFLDLAKATNTVVVTFTNSAGDGQVVTIKGATQNAGIFPFAGATFSASGTTLEDDGGVFLPTWTEPGPVISYIYNSTLNKWFVLESLGVD